jgi:hypothetical protein
MEYQGPIAYSQEPSNRLLNPIHIFTRYYFISLQVTAVAFTVQSRHFGFKNCSFLMRQQYTLELHKIFKCTQKEHPQILFDVVAYRPVVRQLPWNNETMTIARQQLRKYTSVFSRC